VSNDKAEVMSDHRPCVDRLRNTSKNFGGGAEYVLNTTHAASNFGALAFGPHKLKLLMLTKIHVTKKRGVEV